MKNIEFYDVVTGIICEWCRRIGELGSRLGSDLGD